LKGYDTTSQTLAYAGYRLTKNPEILKQLQDEVDAAYDEANGKTPDYSVVQVNITY
jgi:cytochrome P450